MSSMGEEDIGPGEDIKRGGNKVAARDKPDYDGSDLRRTSKRNDSGNPMDFPAEWKKPGWSYQWIVFEIRTGAPVEMNEIQRYEDNGWIPVRPSAMPRMVRADHKGNTIDRLGQRLYHRPEHLTQEALREEYQHAQEQKQAKMAQIYGTGQGEAQRSVQTLDVKVVPPGG